MNTEKKHFRWQPGWLPLMTLIAGAVVGAQMGQVPVGTVIGLAVGALIDRLLFRAPENNEEAAHEDA